MYLTSIKQLRNHEGVIESFDPARLEQSIRSAFITSGIGGAKNEQIVLHLTDEAVVRLTLSCDGQTIPDVQQLRDEVYSVLLDNNLPLVASSYAAMTQDLSRPLQSEPAKKVGPPVSVRRRLPDERQSVTHKFQIGSHKGYVTVGLYEDGSPGEIFISMSKDGSTISGLLDALATSVSIGLQYGVPLRTLVEKFSHVQFDPSGFTENPNIRFAKSVVDYIFRWISMKFPEMMTKREVQEDEAGMRVIASPEPVAAVTSLIGASPILTERKVYKPFEYPEYFELFVKQSQAHWLPTEVPMEADISDYKFKLKPEEISLITNILRFFTQGDLEVNNNYNTKLIPFFPKPEIKMMLTSFAQMEGIHIWAYSYLNDSLGLPDEEYSAFLKIKAMKEKYDYLQNFNVNSIEDLALNMAVFGGFMEGVSLFSSFAILMNFPRLGRLKGVGQIVTWSIRDETLHSLGVCQLFRDLVSDNRHIWTAGFQEKIYNACKEIVLLEDAFIDACFGLGDISGLKADEVKQYIRYIADRRLNDLGLDNLYKVTQNPLQWLDSMINAKEHANFFENRATEYAKGAVISDWT